MGLRTVQSHKQLQKEQVGVKEVFQERKDSEEEGRLLFYRNLLKSNIDLIRISKLKISSLCIETFIRLI